MPRRPLPIVASLIPLLLLQIAGIAFAQAPDPYRILLPLMLKGTSPAVEIRLSAAADAYVFEGEADTNTGSHLYLFAGYDADETMQRTTRSLLRFDLPGDSATAVEEASLRIYYAGYSDIEGRIRLTTVRAVADSWQETTVTWANQPSTGDHYGGLSTTANDVSLGVYKEIDITTLVQEWLDGSTPNYGIYLIGPEMSGSDYSYRVFASRESIFPPELVIKFE